MQELGAEGAWGAQGSDLPHGGDTHMENKLRNELELTLGSEKILLRPTFENVAAMEANVGSVAYLGWKYSRGVKIKDGKIEHNMNDAVKALPSMAEAAQIIYYNQAATKPEDPTLKKFSLEEIWELVLEEGASVTKTVVVYLTRLTSGQKQPPQVTEEEKKS